MVFEIVPGEKIEWNLDSCKEHPDYSKVDENDHRRNRPRGRVHRGSFGNIPQSDAPAGLEEVDQQTCIEDKSSKVNDVLRGFVLSRLFHSILGQMYKLYVISFSSSIPKVRVCA